MWLAAALLTQGVRSVPVLVHAAAGTLFGRGNASNGARSDLLISFMRLFNGLSVVGNVPFSINSASFPLPIPNISRAWVAVTYSLSSLIPSAFLWSHRTCIHDAIVVLVCQHLILIGVNVCAL